MEEKLSTSLDFGLWTLQLCNDSNNEHIQSGFPEPPFKTSYSYSVF